MADKEAQENQESVLKQMKLFLLIVMVIALAAPLLSTMMAVNAINKKIETIGKVDEAKEEHESQTAKELPMAFYKPLQFLVNLGDSDANHYLRATLSIGAKLNEEEFKKFEEVLAASGGGGAHGGGDEGPKPEPAILKTLEVQEPIIRDVIISIISNYTMDQLVASSGKNELKEVIKHKLREQMHSESLEVYFTAFTLQ